jgi:hypothetical protein
VDIYTFISNILSSLVWPTLVLVALILLRKEIRLLLPSLQKVRYKDFELDFEKRVEQLQKEADQAQLPPAPQRLALPALSPTDDPLEKLINISPRVAIIEAFNYVEEAIREAVLRHGIAIDKFYGVRNAAKALMDHGVLSSKMYDLLTELRILRNQASHTTTLDVTPEDARLYVEQAIRLATAISNL